MRDVGRMRQAVSEICNETNSTDRFQSIFLLELFADQDGIDLSTALE